MIQTKPSFVSSDSSQGDSLLSTFLFQYTSRLHVSTWLLVYAMGSKKRNSVPANPEASRSPKRWNSEFFKNRHKLGKIHDRPFIEFLKDLQVQRSTLDAFLQNSEISGNSWEVEQVRKFFRVSQSFPEARVWVEDRSKTNEYGNATSSKWLNSKELEQALSSKVSSAH